MPSPQVSSPEATDLTAAVAAAQDGDENAFRLLYRAVQPGLLRYLWAHAGSDAEDIAAETWLHVARDLHRFSGDATGFRGWVTTIARHRFLDHVRKQARRPQGTAPVEVLLGLPSADDTEEAALATFATASALEMIAGLPATQAEAVLLTVVMELDAKTAGKVMGKRSGAVRVAAHRGLRRLAEQLTAPGPPAPSQRTSRVEKILPTAENRVTEFHQAAVTGSR